MVCNRQTVTDFLMQHPVDKSTCTWQLKSFHYALRHASQLKRANARHSKQNKTTKETVNSMRLKNSCLLISQMRKSSAYQISRRQPFKPQLSVQELIGKKKKKKVLNLINHSQKHNQSSHFLFLFSLLLPSLIAPTLIT